LQTIEGIKSAWLGAFNLDLLSLLYRPMTRGELLAHSISFALLKAQDATPRTSFRISGSQGYHSCGSTQRGHSPTQCAENCMTNDHGNLPSFGGGSIHHLVDVCLCL
jgi:hypothetical protein